MNNKFDEIFDRGMTNETDANVYISPKFTTQELVKIFPEVKELIPNLIKDIETKRKALIEAIQEFQYNVENIAKQNNKDDFFVWFWADAYIKYFYAPQIVYLDRRLIILRTQLRLLKPLRDSKVSKNRKNSFEYWDDLKLRAKETDFEALTAGYLNRVRRYGNQLKALCPFHEEKTPSFVIYLNENQYHCYGCQKHGDVISFLMEKEKIDFKEAVRRLA